LSQKIHFRRERWKKNDSGHEPQKIYINVYPEDQALVGSCVEITTMRPVKPTATKLAHASATFRSKTALFNTLVSKLSAGPQSSGKHQKLNTVVCHFLCDIFSEPKRQSILFQAA
jgi:hypothetical protein